MFGPDLPSKLSCTYCQDEVSGVLIQCVECEDFVLCLQCYAAGAEIGPHKNDHYYQFVVSDAQDLFKSKGGWSAREELLLLNGIGSYGFGNWEDIALKLETRTAEECKEEYRRTFLEGSIGRLTWPDEDERRPHKLHELALQTAAKPAPYIPPLAIPQEQAELLGYMPNRDDFEKEYNNNADSMISHLNISSIEDDDLDVALKLAQVDMYMEQLRERKRMKKITRDYQLISKFFNSLYHRSKPGNPEQIELEEKLRFLCQLLSCQEFESFITSWLQETSLRRRSSELVQYRQAGLTRYEEIPHYEQEEAIYNETSHNCENNSTDISKEQRLSQLPNKCSNSIDQASHLLSSSESQLCACLNLTPSQYITIKTHLLTKSPDECEASAEKPIMDYICTNNWFIS